MCEIHETTDAPLNNSLRVIPIWKVWNSVSARWNRITHYKHHKIRYDISPATSASSLHYANYQLHALL